MKPVARACCFGRCKLAAIALTLSASSMTAVRSCEAKPTPATSMADITTVKAPWAKCVDLEDLGTSRWRTHVPRAGTGAYPLQVHGGLVYCVGYTSQEGTRYYALDVSDGRVVWRFNPSVGHAWGPYPVDGQGVFQATWAGPSPATGLQDTGTGQRILWLAGLINGNGCSVADGRLLFASHRPGDMDSEIGAQDIATGRVLWVVSSQSRLPLLRGPLYVGNGVVCFREWGKDATVVLDVRTGQRLWEISDSWLPMERNRGAHSVWFPPNGRLVLRHGRALSTYDAGSGKLRARGRLRDGLTYGPEIASGRIYYGTADGEFCAVDLSTLTEVIHARPELGGPAGGGHRRLNLRFVNESFAVAQVEAGGWWLLVLETKSGRPLWAVPSFSTDHVGLFDNVLVLHSGAYYWAVDVRTAAPLWRLAAPEPGQHLGIIVSGNRVFAAVGDAVSVYDLDGPRVLPAASREAPGVGVPGERSVRSSVPVSGCW